MADNAECARQKMATVCRIQDADAHDADRSSGTAQQRRMNRVRKASAATPPLPPLSVEYRVTLDGAICAALVTHLVQFLLYFRGQIPCVYDELLSIVLEHQYQQEQLEQQAQLQSQSGQCRRKKALNGPMKKAVKCMATTERLFRTSLDALFEGNVHSVVLIFGASVFSPREVFVIDFRNESEPPNGGDNSKLPKEKVKRLCAQKLIRTLIATSTPRFTSGLTVTSLHIAALAEKRLSGIPGFVPKQSFRLRLPKSKQANNRTHHFCISGGNIPSVSLAPEKTHLVHQNARQSVAEMQENGDNRNQLHENQEPDPWFCQKIPALDPNLIWYTFDKPIAGFTGAL